MILALLMIVSVSSTSTSNTEVQIAYNERTHHQNFYLAEGATMEAVEDLEGLSVPELRDRTPIWLNDNTIDISDPANWNAMNSAESTIENTINRYSIIDEGVALGSSLNATLTTQLHDYAVYGLCTSNNGQSFINIGFKKRF
jgi:hypothetical protein